MKKNEEENLLLLIERCYENDFYINRKLNNRRVRIAVNCVFVGSVDGGWK